MMSRKFISFILIAVLGVGFAIQYLRAQGTTGSGVSQTVPCPPGTGVAASASGAVCVSASNGVCTITLNTASALIPVGDTATVTLTVENGPEGGSFSLTADPTLNVAGSDGSYTISASATGSYTLTGSFSYTLGGVPGACTITSTIEMIGVTDVLKEGDSVGTDFTIYVGTATNLEAWTDGSAFPTNQPVWTLTSSEPSATLSGADTGSIFAIPTSILSVPGTYTFTASCGTSSESINVTIAGIAILVRPSGGSNWESIAIVAAGGIDSTAHKADIVVQTTLPEGTTVDFTVGIKSDEGKGWPDTNQAAAISINSYSTDSSGKIYGSYLSSNRREMVTIECQDENHNNLSGSISAVVDQRWDEYEGDGWDYEAVFVEDEWAPISFSIKTPNSIPIDGHQITMFPTEIYIDTINPDSLELEPYPDAITAENVETVFGAGTSLADFMEFENSGTTDEFGSVTINQLIHSSPLDYDNVVVSEVYFIAQDDNVYK